MISQNDMVYEWLCKKGSITDIEAFKALGIRRLSARIYDLRERGINVITQQIRVKNRNDTYVTVAKYVYSEGINNDC